MDAYSRQKDFICGALIGGTVALLTSLLFTTRKGKQIQRKIAEVYEDLEGNISDTLSEVSDKEEVEQLHKKAAPKHKHETHHKEDK